MKVVTSEPFLCLPKNTTEVKLNGVLKLLWGWNQAELHFCFCPLSDRSLFLSQADRETVKPYEHGWLPGEEGAEQVLLEIWSTVHFDGSFCIESLTFYINKDGYVAKLRNCGEVFVDGDSCI